MSGAPTRIAAPRPPSRSSFHGTRPYKIPTSAQMGVGALAQVIATASPNAQFKSELSPRDVTANQEVDGSDRTHNPKVGGSNPPPATKKVQFRAGPMGRLFCCPLRHHVFVFFLYYRLFGFWRGAVLAEGHPEIGEGASGLRCEPTIEKHLRPRPP
jgi:hypothetical protein